MQVSRCGVVSLFVLYVALPVPALIAEETQTFAEVAKVFAADPRQYEDFGRPVALDGDRLAVRSLGEALEGAVYVLDRDEDGSWLHSAKLTALDPGSDNRFGAAMSLDADRLVVGSPGHSDDTGAVYVFERTDEGRWESVARIFAEPAWNEDDFGESVSLDGDRMAVGAEGNFVRGAVFIFERDVDGGWSQVAKLIAPDAYTYDDFGSEVSLDGDRLLVAADGIDSVYVFERDSGGDWVATAKLEVVNLDSDFGKSISLDGDRAAIGASGDEFSFGLVYIFETDIDGLWEVAATVEARERLVGSYFGRSVSLDGDLLAVGSFGDDKNGSAAGAAYLFGRSPNGVWTQVSVLRPPDGAESDFFGYSVSLDGERMATGRENDDDLGLSSGSASIIEPVVVSPQLTLAGACPGEIELTLSGVTPRSGVELYSSPAQGRWQVEEGACSGTLLELEDPLLLRKDSSAFDGQGRLVRTVDSSWCGMFVQALDERTCLTSQSAEVPTTP